MRECGLQQLAGGSAVPRTAMRCHNGRGIAGTRPAKTVQRAVGVAGVTRM